MLKGALSELIRAEMAPPTEEAQHSVNNDPEMWRDELRPSIEPPTAASQQSKVELVTLR
jgi:hypothetical protein